MKDFCLIISGGDFAMIPDDLLTPNYIIACDKGWQYAAAMCLKPDLILGDLDSAPIPETDIPILKVPTRKDDTDTMLAARRALELGFKNIAICCAFGARFDHALANIQTAAFLVSNGAKVRLCGADTYALAFTSTTEIIPVIEGFSLSLFSLTDKCEGVTIKGTKYECENETLTNAFPLGVSNVWEKNEASITVKGGILLAVMSKLKENEHI